MLLGTIDKVTSIYVCVRVTVYATILWETIAHYGRQYRVIVKSLHYIKYFSIQTATIDIVHKTMFSIITFPVLCLLVLTAVHLSASQLTDEEKQDLLDLQNRARSMVDPIATNMVS